MKRKKTLKRLSLKNRPLRKRTLKRRRRRRTKLTRKRGGASAADVEELRAAALIATEKKAKAQEKEFNDRRAKRQEQFHQRREAARVSTPASEARGSVGGMDAGGMDRLLGAARLGVVAGMSPSGMGARELPGEMDADKMDADKMDADKIRKQLSDGKLDEHALTASGGVKAYLNNMKIEQEEEYGRIIMDAITRDPALTDENLKVFLSTVGQTEIPRRVIEGYINPDEWYGNLGTTSLSLMRILNHRECCRGSLRNSDQRDKVKQLLTKILNPAPDPAPCKIS